MPTMASAAWSMAPGSPPLSAWSSTTRMACGYSSIIPLPTSRNTVPSARARHSLLAIDTSRSTRAEAGDSPIEASKALRSHVGPGA